MRINDLETFITNEVYHLKEDVVLNMMTPRIVVKNGHRLVFEHRLYYHPSSYPTTINSDVSWQIELDLALSMCSGVCLSMMLQKSRSREGHH